MIRFIVGASNKFKNCRALMAKFELSGRFRESMTPNPQALNIF